MKAKEILDWLGYKQGTATKREIRSLWAAWPETGECIFVKPNSRFARCGLKNGQNYTIGTAFQTIGCEV